MKERNMKNNTANETTYMQLLEAAVSQDAKASAILDDIKTLIRLRSKAREMIALGKIENVNANIKPTKLDDLMQMVELLDSTNKMIEFSLSAMKEAK